MGNSMDRPLFDGSLRLVGMGENLIKKFVVFARNAAQNNLE